MDQMIKSGIIVLDGFDIKFDKKVVFELIDCHEDSPIYEEVIEEYEELEEKVYSLIDAKALIGFGEVPEEIARQAEITKRKSAYVLTTVGSAVSAFSTLMFQNGDYLKGMLADAMADSYLFLMEDALQDILREACAERHVGICKRLEAPHDLPMEVQKIMHSQIKAQELLNIGITSGFMFDPVKTACQILILTDDENEFKTQHDCRKCKAIHCKLRNIPPSQVQVVEKDKSYTLSCSEKENILDALIAHDTYFSAVCGGKGLCGKCKIRLLKGELSITSSDKKIFTPEELNKGYRLACMAYPMNDCKISLELSDESDFDIVSAYAGGDSGQSKGTNSVTEQTNLLEQTVQPIDIDYGIAIDIGTTTIAMNLIGRQTKSFAGSYAVINRQRAYGADVISRIQASNNGKLEELQKSIIDDLLGGIRQILDESKVEANKIQQVVIAGNTTMIHLLMGYSCEKLGVVPFTPVNIKTIREPFSVIFSDTLLSCETLILPGISTFVGGDIVSGLYSCSFFQSNEISLLVDLGTNGEMGIGNKDKILVTSTAAGPAFEGGNITWGMGSVKGAISGVNIEKEKVTVKTIQDAMPVGICGTGVIETVAELVREEYVDETGLLDEDCFEEGFVLAQNPDGKDIIFTQKDVREIQLAKAAVRAGVETLLLRYGVDYNQVECVYLAGGFGFHIDTNKAIQIGMLPEEFKGKIKTVGNSSLGGAVRYITQEGAQNAMEYLADMSEEINLSTDKEFNDFYMEHMFFE